MACAPDREKATGVVGRDGRRDQLSTRGIVGCVTRAATLEIEAIYMVNIVVDGGCIVRNWYHFDATVGKPVDIILGDTGCAAGCPTRHKKDADAAPVAARGWHGVRFLLG